MEKMQIVTFAIEGRGEQTQSTEQVSDDSICAKLNEAADGMTVAVEKELRNLMPLGSGISVQAEMSIPSWVDHPGRQRLAFVLGWQRCLRAYPR